MKKMIIILSIIFSLLIGLVIGSIITTLNIEIDTVDELDNGIVTIKIFGHYIDYYYEYNEIIRSE